VLQKVVLKFAGMLQAVTDPKNVISLAKYMYIKRLIDHYQIGLVLDVGANVGQFGSAMRSIGYKGRIISFEPASKSFQELSTAARGDRNWQVCNYALGDCRATLELNVMSASVFSSFYRPSVAETDRFVDGNTVQRTEAVEVRTLMEVAGDLGIRELLARTFLKCDTQGFDINVLRGAGALLGTIRMLQVELAVRRIYDHSTGMNDMLEFLETAGFSPVSMFPITRLTDWSAIEVDYLGVSRNTA
jgi:FkbM family methyltransferase